MDESNTLQDSKLRSKKEKNMFVREVGVDDSGYLKEKYEEAFLRRKFSLPNYRKQRKASTSRKKKLRVKTRPHAGRFRVLAVRSR